MKDNIDVAGLPTTAGCPAFAYDARRVGARRRPARRRRRGGRRQDQPRPVRHRAGRHPHARTAPLESPVAPGRVSGGSSSGSAVAVATGEVDIALGTDTAGSGPGAGRLLRRRRAQADAGLALDRGRGAGLPLASTASSVFARDVAAAAAAVEVAAGYDPDDPWSRRRPAGARRGRSRRIGVPSPAVLDAACDAAGGRRPSPTLDLRRLRGRSRSTSTPYLAAGDLLYGGAFVAERYAAVGAFVDAHPDDVDPVVGRDHRRGAATCRRTTSPPTSTAWPALRRQAEAVVGRGRRRRRADRAAATRPSPRWPPTPSASTPRSAASPTAATCSTGARAAVPVGRRADGLPVRRSPCSARPGRDRAVWAAAAALAGQPAPAPRRRRPDPARGRAAPTSRASRSTTSSPSRGARLVARTATAPAYRMVAPRHHPAEARAWCGSTTAGAPLEVEVWALDAAAFGSFVDEVPATAGHRHRRAGRRHRRQRVPLRAPRRRRRRRTSPPTAAGGPGPGAPPGDRGRSPPGAFTTVQDHPGRLGYWMVGVPPSGPMDDLSFRLVNRAVGNRPDGRRPRVHRHRADAAVHRRPHVVCLGGADMDADLDGRPVPWWQPFEVRRRPGPAARPAHAAPGCAPTSRCGAASTCPRCSAAGRPSPSAASAATRAARSRPATSCAIGDRRRSALRAVAGAVPAAGPRIGRQLADRRARRPARRARVLHARRRRRLLRRRRGGAGPLRPHRRAPRRARSRRGPGPTAARPACTRRTSTTPATPSAPSTSPATPRWCSAPTAPASAASPARPRW